MNSPTCKKYDQRARTNNRFSGNASVFYFLIVLLILTFSSCYSPRKMDKWIDRQYGEVSNKVKSTDYINIKIAHSPFKDRLSETKKGKTKPNSWKAI